jgi:hypothetical protein
MFAAGAHWVFQLKKKRALELTTKSTEADHPHNQKNPGKKINLCLQLTSGGGRWLLLLTIIRVKWKQNTSTSIMTHMN